MSHLLSHSNPPVHPEEKFTAKNFSWVTTGYLIEQLQIEPSSEKEAVLKKLYTPEARVFAHEIRNPLTNINLAVFMLKSQVKPIDIETYTDIINRSSIRINEIVNDFLLSSGNDPARRDRVSINRLLDEILEIAKDSIVLKNISVRKIYTTTSCELLVDRPQLKIALLNIIVNAIEAMSSQNGELKLTTSVRNGKCIVTIEDNGCGISKKNINHIFKPYFTVKPNGIGIGLATARDILVSHQAGVNVESRENKGTRFILSFNMAL